MTMLHSRARVHVRFADRGRGRAGACAGRRLPRSSDASARLTGAPVSAADRGRRLRRGVVRTVEAARAPWRPSRRPKRASCGSGWSTAGFRGREALVVFLGIRLGVALAAFALFCAADRRPAEPVRGARSAVRLGYVLPGMVLARLAKRRQHRIRLGLPDVLDLLVVSVEAGLGLDQAIQRVGAGARLRAPGSVRRAPADQPRAARRQGASRTRCTTSPIGPAWTTSRRSSTMLVQTDKFGTSVAQSLRVHSETVRTKRRQRAEEAAAKTGVKMVFPLVFCIFPGHLGRHHRAGGDQVRADPRAHGRHEVDHADHHARRRHAA